MKFKLEVRFNNDDDNMTFEQKDDFDFRNSSYDRYLRSVYGQMERQVVDNFVYGDPIVRWDDITSTVASVSASSSSDWTTGTSYVHSVDASTGSVTIATPQYRREYAAEVATSEPGFVNFATLEPREVFPVRPTSTEEYIESRRNRQPSEFIQSLIPVPTRSRR